MQKLGTSLKEIVFIGLGKQNTEDHLRAALNNEFVKVVAVCDVNKKLAQDWGKKLGVAFFSDYKRLLGAVKFDAAVIAVPHNQYSPIVSDLAAAGVHIFKEKPFALNLKEAMQMTTWAKSNNINLTIAAQRRHNRIYQEFNELKHRIGNIYSIHGEYTLNIQNLEKGWRSSSKSGGGAVLDMGYHLLDLITWYFGVPERISAELGFRNRSDQNYDVEDTAKVQFSYLDNGRRILGSVIISRVYPQKDEGLFVYGTDGAIKLFKDKIELYDSHRELVESYYAKPNGGDIDSQFNNFIQSLDDKTAQGNYAHHLKNMIFIDAIYASDKNNSTVIPRDNISYKSILKA
jgi:predicted dehydrogenase